MVRWTAAVAVFAALLVVAPSARSQDAAEKKLEFKFKDASPDKVLEYVAKQMDWILAYGPGVKTEGTVTAYSDTLIPESKVVDFLNTALQKAKLQVTVFERTLKVVTEEDAKKG